MNPDIIVHSSVHEVEFWKRYRTLRKMIACLVSRENLVQALQEETILPEKTRDEALGFLKNEHAQNLVVFHDFLVNFISMSIQGLHHMDITLEFSFRKDGALMCQGNLLHVDEHVMVLPSEEGQRFISAFSWILEDLHPEESLIRVYKNYQERYDRDQGADLNRCRLEVRQEIYPGSTFHARLRLPAQVFIEEEFGQRTWHPDNE